MTTAEPDQNKHFSKLEARLELWHAKLGAAAAKANVVGQEAKIASRHQLDELKAKLAAAQTKLDEAKAAGSDRWEALKVGVEHTWEEIEDVFKRLVH